MLNSLKISNVAIVEELTLSFGRGLNVITGETGAGKSILIDAIALTLGDRIHPDVVRQDRATVKADLTRNGSPRSLEREVGLDGRSKARIDGRNATIAELREEGQRWIELTAQRDGTTLLDDATHLTHIDRFAGLAAQVERLGEFYSRYQALKDQRAGLDVAIRRLKETEELAKFQLAELEAFAPAPGEDVELEKEIRLLEGAETLIAGLGRAVEELDQGAEPLSDRLAALIQEVRSLSRIDPVLKDQESALGDALAILRQVSLDLAGHRDTVTLDPERLDEVRARHGQLNRLIRKYGGSMEALLAAWNDLRSREVGGEDLLRQRLQLEGEIRHLLQAWEKECARVSRARRAILPEMQRTMEQGLRTVGVKQPRFEIQAMPEDGESVEFPGAGTHKLRPDGWDRFEFRISFNPGHEPKALQRVASGGELSRIMLLLRGLAPLEELPPVLVFDEIDTGISGKTARQVGLRLKELSQIRQVILVTHLPQIASLADRHIIIEKQTFPNRTAIAMREVPAGSDEQVEEIARLVGGETVTDASRAAARELIGVASPAAS